MAYHPSSDVSSATSLSWAVKGMACEPTRVTIDEYIESDVTVIENIATLVNSGGYDIDDVTSSVNGS